MKVAILCVTYGDSVANIDISALIQFRKSHGKVGTLTGERPPGRFGKLNVKCRESGQRSVLSLPASFVMSIGPQKRINKLSTLNMTE